MWHRQGECSSGAAGTGQRGNGPRAQGHGQPEGKCAHLEKNEEGDNERKCGVLTRKNSLFKKTVR